MVVNPAFHGVSRSGASAHSALFHGGPTADPALEAARQELEQARGQLDGLERRLEDTRELLSLTRRQRATHCNTTAVHTAAWNQWAGVHAKVVVYGGVFSTVPLMLAALRFGLPPAVGVAAAAGLAAGYFVVVKKLVLPWQADHRVKAALKTERKGLEKAVEQARQLAESADQRYRSGAAAAIMAEAGAAGSSVVAVDEAAVTVGGVRIKVRRSSRREQSDVPVLATGQAALPHAQDSRKLTVLEGTGRDHGPGLLVKSEAAPADEVASPQGT